MLQLWTVPQLEWGRSKQVLGGERTKRVEDEAWWLGRPLASCRCLGFVPTTSLALRWPGTLQRSTKKLQHPCLWSRQRRLLPRPMVRTWRASADRPSPPWRLIISVAALLVFSGPIVQPLFDTLTSKLVPSSQTATREAARLTEDEIDSKLRAIPVFCVTDREGRPLLSELSSSSSSTSSSVSSLGSSRQQESAFPDASGGALGLLDAAGRRKAQDTLSKPAPERRIGYFYLDYRDASNFLRQIHDRQDGEASDLVRDAHIVAIPLDEALKFIPPREGGQGRVPDPSDEFHLVPSEQSVRFAERVLRANGALGASARIRGIPLFSIRGFALQRVVEDGSKPESKTMNTSGGTTASDEPALLTPLFFAPDDVQLAWDRLRQISSTQGTALPSQLPLDRVQVTDLRTVLQEMRQGTGGFQSADTMTDYRSLVFLPSRLPAPESGRADAGMVEKASSGISLPSGTSTD
ncbi:hypothetical protein F1559_003380 [Cyanidiococcus yangmingshanensis]|uniref:Uncharacterized protein n=1 Tax=Cyanidiococcus yangmingshanensis TaxID=2690220 RepID=A0A7J7ICD8_9RHOD|nr:hypothetical protein F1559_003380 [Cyanidiococcus yangmingshanensis]